MLMLSHLDKIYAALHSARRLSVDLIQKKPGSPGFFASLAASSSDARLDDLTTPPEGTDVK
jgi:hypothetical protein